MRKLSIIAVAGALVSLALVLFLYVTCEQPVGSLYKGFSSDVQSSHDNNVEIQRQRQTAVPSPQEVAAIVGPYAGRCPGAVVVGLIDKNKQLILGWGKDVSGHNADGDTMFETASVSKAFAGLLLAQMVQRGKVQLEEPVQKLTDVRVPSMGGRQITLRQLATHSSGLPPWPDNRGDTTNAYTFNSLCGYLRQASLMGVPDSGVMYSNTAFALLGDLLAKMEGTTFDGMLQKYICQPLGMKHTQVGLPDNLQPKLAIGHWADGNVAHPSAPTAGGGADGIRSNVRDLLHFLSAYIDIQPTDFHQAMELTGRSYLQFDKNLDAGLGWFIDRGDGTIEKAGKIAGYRTSIMYCPQHKCAVVVLAGWEAFPGPELGKKLLYLMEDRRDLIESGQIVQ